MPGSYFDTLLAITQSPKPIVKPRRPGAWDWQNTVYERTQTTETYDQRPPRPIHSEGRYINPGDLSYALPYDHRPIARIPQDKVVLYDQVNGLYLTFDHVDDIPLELYQDI